MPFPKVFFDTQIFSYVNKTISAPDWRRVQKYLRACVDYVVTPNTLFELLNGLAGGDDDHFAENKRRAIELLRPSGTELLPFTGEFLGQNLGVPLKRNFDTSPRRILSMLHEARTKHDLLEGVGLTGRKNLELISGIDLNVVDSQTRTGKALWTAELEKIEKQGFKLPPPEEWAASHFPEIGLPDTPDNRSRVAQMLSAAYEHLVTISRDVQGGYNYRKNEGDWLDNQQLYYLSDPNFIFVTAEQKLRRKAENSPQASRILRFEDFLRQL